MRVADLKKIEDMGYDIVAVNFDSITVRPNNHDYGHGPLITVSGDNIGRHFPLLFVNNSERYMDRAYPGWRERTAERTGR